MGCSLEEIVNGCPIIPSTVVFCVAFRPAIAVTRFPREKDIFSNARNFSISILFIIIIHLYTLRLIVILLSASCFGIGQLCISEKIINSEAVPLFATLYIKSNLRIANPVSNFFYIIICRYPWCSYFLDNHITNSPMILMIKEIFI